MATNNTEISIQTSDDDDQDQGFRTIDAKRLKNKLDKLAKLKTTIFRIQMPEVEEDYITRYVNTILNGELYTVIPSELLTIEEYLRNILSGIKAPNFSKPLTIDGTTCSGKSTMIKKIAENCHISFSKVNQLLPQRDFINIDLVSAYKYLEKGLEMNNVQGMQLFDRSCLSNIIMHLALYLMEVYNPNNPLTIFGVLKNYLDSINFDVIVDYVRDSCDFLFLISSDIPKLQKRFVERAKKTGSPNGLFNATNSAYFKMQNAAYSLVGYLYNIPVLDFDLIQHVCPSLQYEQILDIVVELLRERFPPYEQTKDTRSTTFIMREPEKLAIDMDLEENLIKKTKLICSR